MWIAFRSSKARPVAVPRSGSTGTSLHEVHEFGREAVEHGSGRNTPSFCRVIVALSASHSRAADSTSVCEHGIEIEGRAADDLEHLGGGGLLLQQFGEIVGALAQFVEQPGVLDGDNGLRGEVLAAARSACR